MRILLYAENGFNPLWNERVEIHVKNPYIALLRFEVYDEDMFGERIPVAQATYPVRFCFFSALLN